MANLQVFLCSGIDKKMHELRNKPNPSPFILFQTVHVIFDIMSVGWRQFFLFNPK